MMTKTNIRMISCKFAHIDVYKRKPLSVIRDFFVVLSTYRNLISLVDQCERRNLHSP